MVSAMNSQLVTTSLSGMLYSQVSSVTTLNLQIPPSTAKSGAAAGASAAFGASLVNLNPTTLFTFLNAAEVYSLLGYFNLDTDPDFLQFLSNLQPAGLIPPIFKFFIDSSHGANVSNPYQS